MLQTLLTCSVQRHLRCHCRAHISCMHSALQVTWRSNEESCVCNDQGLQPGCQLAAAARPRLQPCHARPQEQRSIWRLRSKHQGITGLASQRDWQNAVCCCVTMILLSAAYPPAGAYCVSLQHYIMPSGLCATLVHIDSEACSRRQLWLGRRWQRWRFERTCSRLTVLAMMSGELTARQRSSSALSSLRSACQRRKRLRVLCMATPNGRYGRL